MYNNDDPLQMLTTIDTVLVICQAADVVLWNGMIRQFPSGSILQGFNEACLLSAL